MGIVTEKWNIAFRQAAGYRNTDAPYTALPGDRDGWYADPFLFEYMGKLYLFAEFFSYKTGRGSIVVFEYDCENHGFVKRREVLSQRFHLSYPQVFQRGKSIFMLPETADADALILYRAIRFPDEWREEKVLCAGVKLVDATLLPRGGAVAQSLNADGSPNDFVILENRELEIIRKNASVRERMKSRPGGAFFEEGGRVIGTAQDCSLTYGGALEFYDFETGETVFRLSPLNVRIDSEKAGILGVHTFNSVGGVEVIDYKTDTISLSRIVRRASSIWKGN
ncbi:MAG: hypothetical protein IJL26_13490 [Clostridia bacterium]|nr:hypothetical protein [Clostridia bacterium]